jgi:hypothetical protein
MLFFFYQIIVSVLLLNMLIAMMGNTFQSVAEDNEGEWTLRFGRALSLLAHCNRSWAGELLTLELTVSQADRQACLTELAEMSGKGQDVDLKGKVRPRLVLVSRECRATGTMTTGWRR